MMAEDQWEWFERQLQRSPDYGLVLWVSSKPWIGDEKQGTDAWFGLVDERKRAANLVARYANNLVMVSGDAHMLAYDSGRNNHYADNITSTFPVFNSAPLDKRGSVKGGPFSMDCHASMFLRLHQYSVMDIEDNGDKLCFSVKGKRVTSLGDTVDVLGFHGCAPTTNNVEAPGGSCSLVVLPPAAAAALFIGLIALLVVTILAVCRLVRPTKPRLRSPFPGHGKHGLRPWGLG
mmetsp:Transcript_13908/g.30151  ORF Transcript_13908/g.30151 Transcript_13908/m.30151 type:complete len:233 (+) Transcript_13908:113-811(+)